MPDYAKLLEAGRAAVADACAVCREVQRGMDKVRAIIKDDKSPVTIADYASQAVVGRVLAQRLGKINLVGEETSAFLRNPEHRAHLDATLAAVRGVWPDATERALLDAIDVGAGDPNHDGFWTLDPIDGTKGFLRSQQYAVSLAYIERGTVVVGVLGCPNLPADFAAPLDVPDKQGRVYFAIKGQGVCEASADRVASRPVRLQRTEPAPGEPIRVCESVESGHSKQDDTARILESFGTAKDPARLDSQAKYAVVARGQADAYLRLPTKKDYVERIWDVSRP